MTDEKEAVAWYEDLADAAPRKFDKVRDVLRKPSIFLPEVYMAKLVGNYVSGTELDGKMPRTGIDNKLFSDEVVPIGSDYRFIK